jgi:hypothetical protein
MYIMPWSSHIDNIITNMTQHHIALRPSRLGNAITSMTQQWHRATTNVTLAVPSPA